MEIRFEGLLPTKTALNKLTGLTFAFWRSSVSSCGIITYGHCSSPRFSWQLPMSLKDNATSTFAISLMPWNLMGIHFSHSLWLGDSYDFVLPVHFGNQLELLTKA
jgi:hypothetical protein